MSALRDVTPVILDVTIGYKGVKAGQIPSDVYKLKSIFLDGKGPPEVHMHVRHLAMKDVPKDKDAFVAWLLQRYGPGCALSVPAAIARVTSRLPPGSASY